MLDILLLNIDEGHDYFRYMKLYFISLLESKSTVFLNFFDKCSTNNMTMKLKTTTDFSKKALYLIHHTQLV